MTAKSDPVLKWLRDLIGQRDLNNAALAAKCDIKKARLRRVLTGAEPMLVDELVAITNALELSPTDVGLPGTAFAAELADGPADAPLADAPPHADGEPAVILGPNAVDPWGNHIEQLFKMAFALGVDFMFLTDADSLADSGVPKNVLERHAGQLLPLQLKAEYHGYNEPKYSEDGISLVLSFDSLYTCRFPWACVRQFVFFPVVPDAAHPAPAEEPKKGAHLRLVE